MGDVELTPTTAEEREQWATRDWVSAPGMRPIIRRLLADLDREREGHPDAGRTDANHYDWFMPPPGTAADAGWLDETEAKMREGLTDPFAHDMAQVVLTLIQDFRRERKRAERAELGLGTERRGNRLNTLTLGSKLAAAQAQAAEYRRALEETECSAPVHDRETGHVLPCGECGSCRGRAALSRKRGSTS